MQQRTIVQSEGAVQAVVAPCPWPRGTILETRRVRVQTSTTFNTFNSANSNNSGAQNAFYRPHSGRGIFGSLFMTPPSSHILELKVLSLARWGDPHQMSMCIFLCVIIFKCIGENMYGCPSPAGGCVCVSRSRPLKHWARRSALELRHHPLPKQNGTAHALEPTP